MLSQRIVRSSATRTSLTAARCLPVIQRRGFLPASLSDRKVVDAKYPERQTLSEAEDPGMVRPHALSCKICVHKRQEYG
jgi:NADH dehydrogenase (ubiquinone) 1 beta subcomplex subunit 8